MKKTYILMVFLGLPWLVSAQAKPQFGFLVKAGNYMLPSKRSITEYDYRTTDKLRLGESYSLGIWSGWSLAKRFRLSVEFLYRHDAYGRVATRGYEQPSISPIPGIIVAPIPEKETKNFSQSSVSLPVKLHVDLTKNGKTSFAIGGGISRTFSSTLNSRTEYNGQTEGPFTSFSYSQHFSDFDYFSTNFQFASGLYQQLAPETFIGLEYTFEKSEGNQLYPRNEFIWCDCLCDCVYGKKNINMNSFALSLRHNILR